MGDSAEVLSCKGNKLNIAASFLKSVSFTSPATVCKNSVFTVFPSGTNSLCITCCLPKQVQHHSDPQFFKNFLASQVILFSTPCSDVLFQDHIEAARTCLLFSSNAGIEKIWTVLTGLNEVSTCSDHVSLLLIQETVWNKFNVYLALSQIFIKNLKKCLLVNMQFILH